MTFPLQALAFVGLMALAGDGLAGELQGRCSDRNTGNAQGFVYGGTYAELWSECGKKVASPIVDNVVASGRQPSRVAIQRDGEVISAVRKIEKSETAQIDNPACGDGRWSKCEQICIEAPPGESLAPDSASITKDFGRECSVPFSSKDSYEVCPVQNGNCAAFAGIEGVSISPKRICATGKNWSDGWWRCFRLRALVRPDPSASAPLQ